MYRVDFDHSQLLHHHKGIEDHPCVIDHIRLKDPLSPQVHNNPRSSPAYDAYPVGKEQRREEWS
uniref:Uncharacterized protein n=1 Tax=Lepeophtheirus salmonis TaxID=72036 RepID=A0A0K2TJ65_LEPSM